MKILHLNLSDSGGGAFRAAYRIHKGLCSENVDSKMLVLYKKTNDNSVFEAYETYGKFSKIKQFNLVTNVVNRIKKLHLKLMLAKYPHKGEIPYFLFGKSQIGDTLQKTEADILHIHWINSFVNFNEKHLKKKPIVWTLHDCNPFTGLCHYFVDCEKYKTQCGYCPILNSNNSKDISTNYFLKKQKRYNRLNLHIVCPSTWMAEKVQESVLLGNFKVSVIQHGLNTSVFSPIEKHYAKAALKINSYKKVVLYGATNPKLNKLKGYHFLYEALIRLKEKYDKNKIQIMIFGETEREPTTYFETIYLGHINDDRFLSVIYSSADVMVVPSIQEAFGQTASEALACGTPVTAFATSGLMDIVDHKKNGYLAKPFESDDLANGISWCLENNNDGQLSINAREKVLNNFTMDIMTAKYMSLYKSMLTK
jgi:glycosyltransferase involved in cell wall biosynthesis